MSPQQTTIRHNAIKVADALNSIEGAPVSDFAKQLSKQWADGTISAAEMKEQLLRKHRRG